MVSGQMLSRIELAYIGHRERHRVLSCMCQFVAAQKDDCKKRRSIVCPTRVLLLERCSGCLKNKHEASECHKEAIPSPLFRLPPVDMFSSQHTQQKENREPLLKIVSNLKFLVRRGLLLRGDRHGRVMLAL